ncbi:MAG: malto-oligosyltrehalose synthase [Pirellulales bacterium]
MSSPASDAPTDARTPPSINRIPRATYRLQLQDEFGFQKVGELPEYLEQLGISDLYLSPLFRARKDSSHGYDVVDHAVMERDFGEPGDFSAMAQSVRQRGMGILLDVVPNHMGINDPANRWWYDVLENGEMSRYARYFDIDWHRLPESLRHKVLLPVLGDHFGHVLERGELRLLYEAGRFRIAYFEHQFPLSPHSWPLVLRKVLEHLEGMTPEADESSVAVRVELESITTQLVNLPPKHDHSRAALCVRYREQSVASQRLTRLVHRSDEVRVALERSIDELSGIAQHPRTFDALEALLDDQWYRLAYWRVAADEINYRRFFDINELAAIRVEEPEVFAAVHALVERLLREDQVTGVRIDHPDGLMDPEGYLEDLQRLFRGCRQDASRNEPRERLYVVVEKILTGEEPLPTDWPTCGTTGYELLNDLNRVLVDEQGLEYLRSVYASLTGVEQPPAEIVYNSKKRILDDAMPSELHMLAGQLHRLTQRHRMSRDFTFPALLRALRELIACFPVYRTYVPPEGWEIDDADFGHVMAAVRWAKRRNPTMATGVFDFLGSVLLLQFPLGVDHPDRERFREFVLRFQQVTGPVTAKGIEDTSFYRYYPLASLNEVGGELDARPLSIGQFHRRMQHRASDWPHGLSATATHDTKRGEDVRARLHVLSEVAEQWTQAVREWQEINRPLLRALGPSSVPSRNEEYLLYQTLVGTWPLAFTDDTHRTQYRDRITRYIEKAIREAKVNTSWTNPIEDYEEAVLGFACDLLDPQRSAPFLQKLHDFVASIADAGFINSLAQVALKCIVPGVPDFYQGTELWDFNLVDPDNRRPVDYALRQQLLGVLRQRFASDAVALQEELLRNWPDERIKLLVLWRTLQVRTTEAETCQYGDYVPLAVSGNHAEHVLALARRHHEGWVLVVAALRVQGLVRQQPAGKRNGLPPIDWQDTRIELPPDAPHRWLDAYSATQVESSQFGQGNNSGDWCLSAQQLLSPLPLALLTPVT